MMLAMAAMSGDGDLFKTIDRQLQPPKDKTKYDFERRLGMTIKESDKKIREALKQADNQGKLGVIAAVVGIAGGEKELRKIMNSSGDLHIMDRGMLGVHLEI